MVWGRWRYDLVAFSALAVAVIAGVVQVEEAFSGFGHPATVIIAMVLIVSRGVRSQQKYILRIASCGFFPVK
jgi:di/tricarboxylate transporter